jgi:uncharacterized protein YjaZ
MIVLFAESKFWDKRPEFKTRYEAKILRAAAAAGKLLPKAPKDITFLVQAFNPNWDVIPEYGSGAYTKHERLILLSIDPGLPYGEEKQLEYVRYAVFHEMNHASRFNQGLYHPEFLDRCIFEGLATVFERDKAGAEPLYGEYDAEECRVWLEEIEAEFSDDMNYEYMFQHKDGRKWIGYKVGTWIVDEALKHSKKNIMQLTELDCTEIRGLAKV